jgi:hypothetical protein
MSGAGGRTAQRIWPQSCSRIDRGRRREPFSWTEVWKNHGETDAGSWFLARRRFRRIQVLDLLVQGRIEDDANILLVQFRVDHARMSNGAALWIAAPFTVADVGPPVGRVLVSSSAFCCRFTFGVKGGVQKPMSTFHAESATARHPFGSAAEPLIGSPGLHNTRLCIGAGVPLFSEIVLSGGGKLRRHSPSLDPRPWEMTGGAALGRIVHRNFPASPRKNARLFVTLRPRRAIL